MYFSPMLLLCCYWQIKAYLAVPEWWNMVGTPWSQSSAGHMTSTGPHTRIRPSQGCQRGLLSTTGPSPSLQLFPPTLKNSGGGPLPDREWLPWRCLFLNTLDSIANSLSSALRRCVWIWYRQVWTKEGLHQWPCLFDHSPAIYRWSWVEHISINKIWWKLSNSGW